MKLVRIPETWDARWFSAIAEKVLDEAHVNATDPHAQYVKESATTVADASGGATVDAECRAQLNALLAALRASGAIGT